MPTTGFARDRLHGLNVINAQRIVNTIKSGNIINNG
jgi:hypothetical protein